MKMKLKMKLKIEIEKLKIEMKTQFKLPTTLNTYFSDSANDVNMLKDSL